MKEEHKYDYMKKFIALLLVSVIVLTLVACGNDKGQDYLNAIVLEITDTEIIAECIAEHTNQLTGKKLAVSKNVVSASGVPQIKMDDEIRVVFDFGKINEVDNHVKMERVYAIYLLDENGNVIAN